MKTALISTALVSVLCYTSYNYLKSKRVSEQPSHTSATLVSPFNEMAELTVKVQSLQDATLYPLTRALKGVLRLSVVSGGDLTIRHEESRFAHITGFLTPYTLETLNLLNDCNEDAKFRASLTPHVTALTRDLEQAVSFYNQEYTKHLNSAFPHNPRVKATKPLVSPIEDLKELVVFAPLPLFLTALAADIAQVSTGVLVSAVLGVLLTEIVCAVSYLRTRRKLNRRLAEELNRDTALTESLFGSLLELERIIDAKDDHDKLKLKLLHVTVKEWNCYFNNRSYTAKERLFAIIDPEFTDLHEAIRKISSALQKNVSVSHPPLKSFIDMTIADLEQKYPTMPKLLLVK